MGMVLINGDICRDGGSIVADFRYDDGSDLFLMLEVSRVPEPGEERSFKHLYAGPTVQNSCDTSPIVGKGSEKERLLLAQLDSWLAGDGLTEANEKAVRYVMDLRRFLSDRKG